MQDFIARNTAVQPCRCPDHLLLMNLPPMFGRRDAALDVACALTLKCDFDKLSGEERGSVYWRISELLKESSDDSCRILMLLSNPDTRTQELHLLKTLIMLERLSAAVANFFEMGNWETESSVLSVAETGFLKQLRKTFENSSAEINRYRTYAKMSFSGENSERYERSYSVFAGKDKNFMERFGVDF